MTATQPTRILPSDNTASRTLSLSRANRRLMFVEAESAGDLEIGGGLYGPDAWTWRDTIEVAEAQPPGPNSRAWTDKLGLHYDDLEAGESGDRRKLNGFWHTHPSGGAGLSEADLKAFAQMRDEWGMPQFLAVIVTPDKRTGWRSPQLHAWRMWSEDHCGRERVRYEPVTVTLRGSEPDPWPQPTPIRAPRPPLDLSPEGRAATLRKLGLTPAPEPEPDDERDRRQHTSSRKPRRPTTQLHHNAAKWMVAQRTFTDIDGPDPVTIEKGELVDPLHPLVHKNPDAFKRS